jgi:hypothetical protein
MKIVSFLGRISHSPIYYFTLAFLVALTCGSVAFCGEIPDAAKSGEWNITIGKKKPTPINPIVPWCEVAKHPEKYINERIRVRAIYGVGFEWSEIFSLRCVGSKSTWLEFSPDIEESYSRKAWKQLRGDYDSILAGIVLEGRLTEIHGGNGHLGRYALKFTADCIINAKRLATTVVELSPKIRKRIEQYENSGISSKDLEPCGTITSCEEIHDAAENAGSIKAKALFNAAENGDLEMVKALLKENPKLISSRNDECDTPLHRASDRGHEDMVSLLLAKKAKVTAVDKYGDTPLHLAAEMGHKDVAKLLLARGAKINAKNNEDETPLHLAALMGRKDVVEFLRQHGGHE